MKKLFLFIKSFFIYDSSSLREEAEQRRKRLKELQEERDNIINGCEKWEDFTEIQKIKLDIAQLKIDNFLKY